MGGGWRGRAGLGARCWAVRLRRWDAAGAGEAADWQRPPCNQRAAPPRPPPAPPRPGRPAEKEAPAARRRGAAVRGDLAQPPRCHRGGPRPAAPSLHPRGQRQVRPCCRRRGRLGAGFFPPLPMPTRRSRKKGPRRSILPPALAAESGPGAWRAAPRLGFHRSGVFHNPAPPPRPPERSGRVSPSGFAAGPPGRGAARDAAKPRFTENGRMSRAPLPGGARRRPQQAGAAGIATSTGGGGGTRSGRRSGNTGNCRVSSRSQGEAGSSGGSLGKAPGRAAEAPAGAGAPLCSRAPPADGPVAAHPARDGPRRSPAPAPRGRAGCMLSTSPGEGGGGGFNKHPCPLLRAALEILTDA